MTAERRLLLLRHAKAALGDPGPSGEDLPEAADRARPLAARGRADAASLGRRLRERPLLPELALVSPALRTRETFEHLALPQTPHLEVEGLYLASPERMLEILAEHGGTAATLLVVGHNPGLHRLADHLAGPAVELRPGLPTCTLAMFSFLGEWAGLATAQTLLREVFRPGSRAEIDPKAGPGISRETGV